MPLPAGTEAKDVRVDVHRARLSVEIRGVVLHAGALWNAGETHGVDVDAAAWVVVRHGCDRFERDATPVLQVELHKKKSAWWKAVWAGHPTIEPWEVPGWREATLGDGTTCPRGDAPRGSRATPPPPSPSPPPPRFQGVPRRRPATRGVRTRTGYPGRPTKGPACPERCFWPHSAPHSA